MMAREGCDPENLEIIYGKGGYMSICDNYYTTLCNYVNYTAIYVFKCSSLKMKRDIKIIFNIFLLMKK